jgi:hypothetical protein
LEPCGDVRCEARWCMWWCRQGLMGRFPGVSHPGDKAGGDDEDDENHLTAAPPSLVSPLVPRPLPVQSPPLASRGHICRGPLVTLLAFPPSPFRTCVGWRLACGRCRRTPAWPWPPPTP